MEETNIEYSLDYDKAGAPAELFINVATGSISARPTAPGNLSFSLYARASTSSRLTVGEQERTEVGAAKRTPPRIHRPKWGASPCPRD